MISVNLAMFGGEVGRGHRPRKNQLMGWENTMIIRTAVVALAVAVLTGCGSGPAVVQPSEPGAAATMPVSATMSPEDSFLGEVRALSSIQASDGELLSWGTFVCDNVGTPGVVRQDQITVVRNNGPYDQRSARVVVDAAKANLCRDKAYVPAPATPLPTGPMDVITIDGIWDVGTGEDADILPGRYESDGISDRELGCYWAKLDREGKTIDNDIGQGPRKVTLHEGDTFETNHCGTWTREG